MKSHSEENGAATVYLAVKCPYCQHPETYVTAFFSGRALLECNSESGGCDEYYAIAWVMQPTVKVYALEEYK